MLLSMSAIPADNQAAKALLGPVEKDHISGAGLPELLTGYRAARLSWVPVQKLKKTH